MAKTNYTIPPLTTDMAKAYGRDLSISTKAAINICNTLRGMDANKAVQHLDAVIAKKQAIAFTRFTDGVGHRKGDMAAGRYPVKAAQAIQAIIKSAIANAANQGLATELNLVHICAHKAATPFHQGRQRRRAMKRTHIEVAVKEAEARSNKVAGAQKTKSSSVKKAPAKQVEEKAASKAEEKTEAPKVVEKPAVEPTAEQQKTVTGDAQ